MAGKIITVEDNSLLCGFGSYVLETLNELNLKIDVLRLGIPDRFIEQGKPAELYSELGIDENGIYLNAKNWLNR